MLKTLKWVYNLGVNQERVRIAAHLEREAQGSRLERDQLEYMLRDTVTNQNEVNENKQKRKQKLEFNAAVNARVEVIIAGMFQSEDRWVPGNSVLYPDEERRNA